MFKRDFDKNNKIISDSDLLDYLNNEDPFMHTAMKINVYLSKCPSFDYIEYTINTKDLIRNIAIHFINTLQMVGNFNIYNSHMIAWDHLNDPSFFHENPWGLSYNFWPRFVGLSEELQNSYLNMISLNVNKYIKHVIDSLNTKWGTEIKYDIFNEHDLDFGILIYLN